MYLYGAVGGEPKNLIAKYAFHATWMTGGPNESHKVFKFEPFFPHTDWKRILNSMQVTLQSTVSAFDLHGNHFRETKTAKKIITGHLDREMKWEMACVTETTRNGDENIISKYDAVRFLKPIYFISNLATFA